MPLERNLHKCEPCFLHCFFFLRTKLARGDEGTHPHPSSTHPPQLPHSITSHGIASTPLLEGTLHLATPPTFSHAPQPQRSETAKKKQFRRGVVYLAHGRLFLLFSCSSSLFSTFITSKPQIKHPPTHSHNIITTITMPSENRTHSPKIGFKDGENNASPTHQDQYIDDTNVDIQSNPPLLTRGYHPLMTHPPPSLLSLIALNELDDKRIKVPHTPTSSQPHTVPIINHAKPPSPPSPSPCPSRQQIRPLVPPQILMEDLPLSLAAAQTIITGRQAAEEIIKGRDDRLLVIVGPCSIHDTKAAIEYGKKTEEELHYFCASKHKPDGELIASNCFCACCSWALAHKLKAYAAEASAELAIIMRVYFEKPRTTVGWKGLINDPQLNNSFQINKGLRIARTLLLDLVSQDTSYLLLGCGVTHERHKRQRMSWKETNSHPGKKKRAMSTARKGKTDGRGRSYLGDGSLFAPPKEAKMKSEDAIKP